MHTRSRIVFAVALAIALGAGSAFAQGQIVVAMEQEPVGFDPHKIPAASSRRIINLVYESLTNIDESFEVVPWLAEKWAFSADSKVITFSLRKGVKFHNGREMTSDDVKWSLERVLDPATGATGRSYLSSVSSIEAPDKYSVVVRFKSADTAFLANVGSTFLAIVPKEVADFNTTMVGTGPFMLEKVEAGQYLQLKKNPSYFQAGLPRLDSVKYQFIKDESARLAAVRAGKIDVSQVTNISAKLLEREKDVRLVSYLSTDYNFLGMNVAKAPYSDPRVREAISLALDREAIVKVAMQGQGQPTGPMSPAHKSWALPVSAYPTYKRDVAKAKRLLAEAGYPSGFEMHIDTMAAYQDLVDTSQVVQQQLAEAGIKASITKMETAAYVALWKSKAMEVMVGKNGSGTNPDRALRFFFSTAGSANVWNYSNPAYDALVQKALETGDAAARRKAYNEAQLLVVADAPNLFLASPMTYYAISETVKDFNPSSAGEALALLKASMSK